MEVLLVGTSLSKFTQVVAWILQDHVSLRVSFFDGLFVVPGLVAVVDLSHGSFVKLAGVARLGVWNFDSALPWPHALTVLGIHPFRDPLGSLHLHDLDSGSIGRKSEIVSLVIDWPEHTEVDEVALPLVVELNMPDRVFSLWKFIIFDIFLILILGFVCQVNLVLDLLVRSLWEDPEISDPVDATLPSDHLGLVLVHQDILVCEELVMGDHRLAHLPNVALSPGHMALESFPGTQLRDGAEHADALSWDGLVEHLEVHVVQLRVWVVS